MTTKKKKGKQRQAKPAPEPVPETAAVAAEESQSKGPLGAPILSTSDPQILEEEAEEEEDSTFQVGETTPDETAPGGEENRPWAGDGAEDRTTSPIFSTGNEDEFRNVWGSDRL